MFNAIEALRIFIRSWLKTKLRRRLKRNTDEGEDICLPEQKYSEQTAEVSTSSPTCSNTNVSGSFFSSVGINLLHVGNHSDFGYQFISFFK